MAEEDPPQDWEWLDHVIGTLDDDFTAAVLERSAEQLRPALSDVFN
ncbi:hypothetical protein RFM26_07160 [Mesorhizobium sp. VK23B]|uniref:Uncharacterized protein n=1 Tax=Mesorhizobium dulcispinae TaxID=3072316 RepID=A0ABU4XGZ2_9HYPH|nr:MULTISPECIES: hypothetical protein [unclassified Mesorhizobium]MDX8465460.1 hypothetical protein [Mesorhizobium sp. VK23B]MDX8472897.1 hypothetical protein [Mesorhizobium sp. VK23A]